MIGTSEYADSGLPDILAIETTINTLAATLTDPDFGQLAPEHCSAMVNEGDLREVGRLLGDAAEEATDLLFIYYAGRILLDKRTRSLHLGLPDSDPKRPVFNSLDYAILRDTVLDSRAAMKVIVLDCRFPEGLPDIGDELHAKGGYVLASSFPEATSSVLPRHIHTAFSSHLNDVLRDGVPGGPGLLRADDIYAYLLGQMRQDGLPDPEARGTYKDGPLALLRNRGSFSVPMQPSTTGEFAALPVPSTPSSPDAIPEPADEEPPRWFNEWMLDWVAGKADRLTENVTDVAVTLLSQAAASVEPRSERYAWFASRLAQALYRAGELNRAQDFCNLGLDCTDDTDVRVHLHSTLAQCLDKAGSPPAALAVLGRALATPGLTGRHRAGLLVLAARSHNNHGEFAKAEEIASEALRVASDAGDDSAADWAQHIISMAGAMAAAKTDFGKLQEC